MKYDWGLSEVRDVFIEIEEANSVFKLKNKDVYFWKLIRMDLFSEIIKQKGFVKTSHPLSKMDKIIRFFKLIKFSFENILRKRYFKNYNVLLLTHGRKSLIDGKFEDIYLYDVIHELNNAKLPFLILDRPDFYGNHTWSQKEDLIFFERFGHIKRELLYPFYMKNINLENTIQKIKHIEAEIFKELNIRVDLESLIKKKVFRFQLEKRFYDKLLNTIKPQVIYLLVSYGKEELISSAKELGIKTIELQHGIINDYHMGYYFPFDFNIPYFPDELYTFGDFWMESVKFPKNSKQMVKSFKCLKPNFREIVEKNLKKEQVLFLSQPTIGDKLSKVAADFILKSNVMVYYKLHPSEFMIWEEKYKELVELRDTNNLKVVTDDISLNQLFNNCKYVVGVNSTAIIESLLYQCNTYVIDLEGYQYMNNLIEKKYVKLISEKFDINDLSDTKTLENPRYFYK